MGWGAGPQPYPMMRRKRGGSAPNRRTVATVGVTVDGASVGVGMTTMAGVGARVGGPSVGGVVCAAVGGADGAADGTKAAVGATVGVIVIPANWLPGAVCAWERRREERGR